MGKNDRHVVKNPKGGWDVKAGGARRPGRGREDRQEDRRQRWWRRGHHPQSRLQDPREGHGCARQRPEPPEGQEALTA